MNELESPELELVAIIAPETALEAEPEPAPETAPEPEPMWDFAPGPVEALPAEPPMPIAQSPVEALPASPPAAPIEEPPAEPDESFADLLRDFERSHSHRASSGRKQLEGIVISVSADQVFLDIGYKTEGVLPRSAFANNAEDVKPGDVIPVSVTGRNEEHYYELSRFRVAVPRDWTALETAFAEKLAVAGTVTAVIKGGLSVDVGVRAFMPASRSGTRDAAELEALVGSEITCRITKLDVIDEDVVVDRRVVLEEQARGLLDQRRAAFKEGDTVSGTVRTLVPYGAFVDIGGVDGLLHISDISRTRISKPEEVLTAGQEIQVRILKIDPETKKISLGLKQLLPEPWETAPARYQTGQRVSGTVTRVTDFGAFVEIEPGLEGLIHISEMSWAKKVRHPSDILKQGDRVDSVILSVKPAERRIALGLKQALADPWLDVQHKFPVGAQVEGPVTKIMTFGAFVEIAEGVEGLVHISEIAAGRRLNHPGDVLRVGQRVQALVLAIDSEKRQIKLSIKQLIPTSIDEYIAEHTVGDTVSGRVVEFSPAAIHVELGDGIRAACRLAPGAAPASAPPAKPEAKADLSLLSSMLKDRWKGNVPAPSAQPEPLAEGQIRTFKIVSLDAEKKSIEVELA
jgi:small subunit ribosomal protein S1